MAQEMMRKPNGNPWLKRVLKRRTLVRRLAAQLFPILLLANTAFPAGEEPKEDRADTARDMLNSVTDCRYLTTENPELAFDDRAPGGTWFPQGDLFRPPVADLRQPRFYISPRRVRFEGDALPAGGTTGPSRSGLWGWVYWSTDSLGPPNLR